jgi:predicted nucleic acid-binding protein
LAAAEQLARGWDFADALHHALSAGCDEFVTLDTDLAKRAAKHTGGTATAVPKVVRL